MSSYSVLREFHPIGQGAFYTERHENFNVVYDCGAMPLTNLAKSVVSSTFNKDEVIDILFISHLDYDHVSAISTLLKSVKSIKTVVLPLLDPEEESLLVNLNRMLSLSLVNLIKNPQAVFGPNTKVIKIKAFEGEDEGEGFIDLSEFPYGNSKTNEVKSGVKLRLKDNLSWVFVPYNIKVKDRREQLIQKLTSAGFDIDKMRKDPSYSLHRLTTPHHRKTLRKIYAQIDGGVNENSMLLYSGPCESGRILPLPCIFGCDFSFGCKKALCLNYMPGCIYTGDTDLTKISIANIYKAFLTRLGTVQLPHHGSKHSFSSSSLNGLKHRVFIPVSYGIRNHYGHPAPCVINNLTSSGNLPLFINELPSSKIKHYLLGAIYDE